MATRQITIDTVKEALIAHYVKQRRPMTINELASASGFGPATIRKMHKAGEMWFADWWNASVSVGGKVRVRLSFEPTKIALAECIKETCHGKA